MIRPLAVCTVLALFACRTPDGSDLRAEFAPAGTPNDWGGAMAVTSDLTAEARVANAAARRLNEAAALGELVTGWPPEMTLLDGVVSVPLKLLANDDDFQNQPFGDGQKNSSITWNGWDAGEAHAPVSAALVWWSTGEEIGHVIVLEVAAAAVPASGQVVARISAESGESVEVPLAFDAGNKVWRAILVSGADVEALTATTGFPTTIQAAPAWAAVLADRYAWPRIKMTLGSGGTFADQSWPLLFRFPSQSRATAQSALPENQRQFATYGDVDAPPGAASQLAEVIPHDPCDLAATGTKRAFFCRADGVHHHFHDGENVQHTTATGGVDTFIVREKPGGLEVLYTCFDPRNAESEANLHVPSGAGWHSIGGPTPGETIVHNLSDGSPSAGIFAGWAVRTPYPFAEAAPYDAKDVAVFRVLRPDEAFTTQRGHFHWYAVDAATKACVTIWKHACELKGDVDLGCQ